MKTMKAKPFLKAAAVALTIATISGIPATPMTSIASAAITLDDKNHDAKAIEVLEASIKALGGPEELKSIKNMKIIGTISVPMAGIKGDIEIYTASPNNLLLVVDFPAMGGETLQGLKNGVVWTTDPMNGPRIMPADEAKDLIKQADLQYALNFRENYDTIEYAGEVKFDEQAAHKLRLVTPDETESFEYYSVESGLQIGTEGEAENQMGKINAVTILRNYKEVDGHLVPTKLIQKVGPTEVVMTFETIEFGEIKESLFDFPPAVSALIKATADKEKSAP